MRWHPVARAISWNDSKKEKKGKILALSLASAVTLAVLSPAMRAPMAESMDHMVSVIVRALPGGSPAAQDAVERAGGEVGQKLRILNGFAAEVPADSVGALAYDPSVLAVTPDREVRMLDLLDEVIDTVTDTVDTVTGSGSTDPATSDPASLSTDTSSSTTSNETTSDSASENTVPTSTAPAPYVPGEDKRSVYAAARAINAPEMYNRGYTGQGIDVAVLDTGVVPVEGLDDPNKVVNGPDFSFESQVPELEYMDTYGHGTHIAGIIAGRDDAVVPGGEKDDKTNFLGIAPDARIVNIKLANFAGAVDVSQVIAAIDWTVRNRATDGLNIRVLNLSFGTDGIQDYVLDPLAYAAEVAWRKGIVVVAAAGNAGFGSGALSNPAFDPYVVAVGADDIGTKVNKVYDDTVPSWSSNGNQNRRPDVIAPGVSVASLRNQGSYIDDNYPAGVVNDRFFRGSGTSQSAAVVSGAVALMLEARPTLTPDQIKALLMKKADELPNDADIAQGDGVINLDNIYKANTPSTVQTHPVATGLGTLQGARGSLDLVDEDGNVLEGELDIFGNPWDAQAFASGMFNGTDYLGGPATYVGSGGFVSGKSWAGKSWAGKSWASDPLFTGKSWAGKSWASDYWSGKSWAGKSWAGKSWAGKSWAGKSWAGKAWGGKAWAGSVWE